MGALMKTESIRLIEELAANAWRPEIEQHIGGWRLRFSGGDSRRVNSVWPNRDPGPQPLEEYLALAEAFYQRVGIVPRFQVCPAVQPEDLPDRLAARGYSQTAHTTVMTANADALSPAPKPSSWALTGTEALTDAWFETYTRFAGYSVGSLPVRRGILSRIGPAAHFVMAHVDDIPAATGLGVAERGWMGVFCMVTDAERRRQGLASAVIRALAYWGRYQGAENVYLQVMDDNPAAFRLYEKLGFTPFYQYAYREKL